MHIDEFIGLHRRQQRVPTHYIGKLLVGAAMKVIASTTSCQGQLRQASILELFRDA